MARKPKTTASPKTKDLAIGSSEPMFLDIESFSPVDLRAKGAAAYWAHPDAHVVCMSAGVLEQAVVWMPDVRWRWNCDQLLAEARHPDVPSVVKSVRLTCEPLQRLPQIGVSHNVPFDARGWASLKWGEIPTWYDTLLAARTYNYPRVSLEAVGQRLFGVGKLSSAYPKRPFVRMGEDELRQCVVYNLRDLLLLQAIWSRLWPTVDENNRKSIAQHWRIMSQGIPVDVSLARALVEVEDELYRRENDRIARLAGYMFGCTLLDRPKELMKWLARKNVHVESADYETLEEVLKKPGLPDDVYEVVRARLLVAGIVRAKAAAIVEKQIGGLLFDQQAWGKAHTGRSAGQDVQVQNFVKGECPGDVLDRVVHGLRTGQRLQMIETEVQLANQSHPDRLKRKEDWTVRDFLSACARPMARARDGKFWLSMDYASIELCGGAWIAPEPWVLDALRQNRNLYIEFGSKYLYGRQISKADEMEYDVSKRVVLGGEYQMGEDALEEKCKNEWKIDISPLGLTFRQIIERYRDAHPGFAGKPATFVNREGKVIHYREGGIWRELQAAAIRVVKTRQPAQVGADGRVRMEMYRQALLVILPSGRRLIYADAALQIGNFNKEEFVFTHPERGRRSMHGGRWFENIVQAMCWCLLRDAMIRIWEKYGLDPNLHVHDDVNYEAPDDPELWQNLVDEMAVVPTWAAGWPIRVEAAVNRFYRKSDSPTTVKLKSRTTKE